MKIQETASTARPASAARPAAMKQSIRAAASAARRRMGTTTVEFAVVAPIIFLFFFGGMELSAVNFVRQTAGNASYEACRKLIIPGGTPAQATEEAMRLMNALGLGQGVVVNVSQSKTQATVTIEVPAHLHSWGLTRFTGNKTIRQSCTLTPE